MDDITVKFPGCTLSTGEIRDMIRNILGFTDSDYNCYKCFQKVNISSPKCPECYQIYCLDCARFMGKKTIDHMRCPHCEENRKFLQQWSFPTLPNK